MCGLWQGNSPYWSRNPDGNPDSPNDVVFLTTIIGVIVVIETYYIKR